MGRWPLNGPLIFNGLPSSLSTLSRDSAGKPSLLSPKTVNGWMETKLDLHPPSDRITNHIWIQMHLFCLLSVSGFCSFQWIISSGRGQMWAKEAKKGGIWISNWVGPLMMLGAYSKTVKRLKFLGPWKRELISLDFFEASLETRGRAPSSPRSRSSERKMAS